MIFWFRFNEIVYLSHGASDSLGRGVINKENISQIQSLADAKNPIQKLLLIACNAGAGFDPIAQDMANSLQIPVEAADGYVDIGPGGGLGYGLTIPGVFNGIPTNRQPGEPSFANFGNYSNLFHGRFNLYLPHN